MKPILFAAFVKLAYLGIIADAAGQTIDPHVLYQDHCASCHGAKVEELARETLIKKSSGLFVRKRDVELRQFLNSHGRLKSEEADSMTKFLEDKLAESTK